MPLAIVPWILEQGSARVDATAEIEMSRGKVGEPVSLAPDVWFGATDGLTVGITESRYALSGFRGADGGGFCVTGTEGACAHLYNNGGIEAWQALARGSLPIVVGGGVYATDLSKGFYAGKLGFKTRAAFGRLSLLVMPSVFVAITDRDAMPANLDQLYVPAALTLRLTSDASFGIGSGVKGQVKDIAKHWIVPLGAFATYKIDHVQLGASFVYGSLWAAADNPPSPASPVKGPNLRVVQAWISYAFGGRHAAPPPPPPPPTPTLTPAPAPEPAPPPAAEAPAAPSPEPVYPGVEPLPEAEVAAIVAAHSADLAACEGGYEPVGTLAIAFLVDAKGHVIKTNLSGSISDLAVSDCLLRQVRSWQFPERSGQASGSYSVTYPAKK